MNKKRFFAILMSILMLFQALPMTALAGTVSSDVLRVGADDDVIRAAAERGDLGSDFLNEIAKVLPSLSHYIFIGIVGALCLAFAVLIFVIFSRRPALAFRTLAVDMLIVSGLYAFGMLFINTYCGLSMYLPCKGNAELDAFYKTLDWNIETKLVK